MSYFPGTFFLAHKKGSSNGEGGGVILLYHQQIPCPLYLPNNIYPTPLTGKYDLLVLLAVYVHASSQP